MLTGMAKTGVHGAGMLAVPLLVFVFGGQASSGVMLPILILADVFGVWYYHRHAEWKYLRILFPWAAIGVLIGTFTGNYIDDDMFRFVMADRKSTRLNSSHGYISYAVFCLKKKKKII